MSRRLLPCSVVLFASLITGCVRVLQTAGVVANPQPARETAVADPPSQAFELTNVDLAASKAEVALFNSDVMKLIKARDFDGLDNMAARFREGKERFIGGGWKIHSFYNELAVPYETPITEKNWQAHLDYLKAWKAAKPQSITARNALVDAYLEYAWFARGDKFAKDVPPAAWPVFFKRLDLAAAEAKEIDDPDADPYGYFMNVLELAKGAQWDRAAFNKAFDEAMRYDPTYPYFYGAKAVYLLPRWSGRSGEWEQFAAQTRDSIGGDDGARLYYLIAADVSQYFGSEFFDENQVSWTDMRKGFQVSVQHFGTTGFRMNQFGALAFNARDPQAVCKTFSFLTSDDFDDEIWKNKEGFENRRRLAQMMCNMPRSDNMRK